jgi:hypothetical protein
MKKPESFFLVGMENHHLGVFMFYSKTPLCGFLEHPVKVFEIMHVLDVEQKKMLV